MFHQVPTAESAEIGDMNSTIKYILWWTRYGDNVGVSKKDIFADCKYTNCYITRLRRYLPNITSFDAIVFGGGTIFSRKDPVKGPKVRSNKQKYIFAMTESAHNHPICLSFYDGFFNWTWTYKLDSNVVWRYLTIYDSDEQLVGPSTKMRWQNSELSPKYELDLANKFNNKTKAAAWFVSNCLTRSKRENFVEKIKIELNKYNLTVDVYGRCGDLRCDRNCQEMLKREYFFYFAFENSFAEDYVTEKVLTAINNFVVPVVYGGADYSRFLPPESYINGKELGVKKLARTMVEIIEDPPRYRRFFKWVPHYKYVDSLYGVAMCELCASLNDEETVSVRHDFVKWWNTLTPGGRTNCRKRRFWGRKGARIRKKH